MSGSVGGGAKTQTRGGAKTRTPRGVAGPSEGLIVADAVTKRFPRGVVALDNVSFTIEPGSFVSVVGPSGCGKSTLLRLIAGLTDLTAGQLTVSGTEVAGPRTDVGVMFQQPTLLEWKTALENALLPLQVTGAVTDDDRKRALKFLRLTGLEGFEHTFPRHLSGGMQQRVALARLLMIGAPTLLLDEPFGALDEFTRERLNLELRRIHHEVQATTVFITHNIAEAVFLADRVFVMTPRPGRLAGILDVPFGQDRGISIMKSPEFTEIAFQARELLGEQL
jgi:NitT/TauT family transport system ATP-binding protein